MRVSVHACNALLLALILSTLSLSAQSLGDNWDTRFGLPGVQAIIESTVVSEDGQIYISGTVAWGNGTPEAEYFLRWDGERWRDLGIYDYLFTVDGIKMTRRREESIQGLALYNGILYAITHDPENYSHSYIIAWDGEKWSLLEGAVFNGWVRKLIAHDSKLYVGGEFSSLSGYPNGEGLVYWDGQGWKQSEAGVGRSFSDFVFNEYGTLYSLGAKWDGQQWVSFGEDTNNYTVQSIVTSGSSLYGVLSHYTNRTRTYHIGQLEGSKWKIISEPATPENSNVRYSWKMLAADRFGRVYLSLPVQEPNSVDYEILRWSGNTWEVLPHKFSGEVRTLIFHDDGSYTATGYFTRINDSLIVKGIARWDGTAWQAFASEGQLNQGLSGNVLAVEHFEGYLYAGGSNIVAVHPAGVHNILRWSEQTGWEDVAGGVDGTVNVIRPHPDGGLLVAGCFNRAGTIAAKNIAHWDGSIWHSIGNGSDVCINDLSTINDTIYAVGGASLLRWAGAGWEQIHIPANRIPIEAVIAGNDGSVYVGGRFDSINGQCVNNIARWKNGAWEGLSSGLKLRAYNQYTFNGPSNAHVFSLAIDSEYLYAGGTFDSAGTILAFQIARWNGKHWQAMDSGLVGTYYQGAFGARNDQASVHSIQCVDGRIYAGGRFAGAGSWDYDSPHLIQTPGLVRWDEENNVWNPLFDYTNYGVLDIAFDDDYIYAAGSGIKAAKDKPSYGIARTQYPSQQISVPLCQNEISFGSQFVGRSVNKDIVISNPNSSNRTLVGTVVVQDGPFSVQGDGSFRLAPGQNIKLPLTFTPTAIGFVTGQVVVRHNSTIDSIPLSVSLSGIGLALNSVWSVEPTMLDFGTQVEGYSRSAKLAVTITNSINSNADLTLEPIQPDTPFRVERGPNGQNTLQPKTLKQGESLTLEIGFDLTKSEMFTEQLIIRHDGEPDGKIVIPLTGIVSPPFAAIHSTPSSIDFGNVLMNKTAVRPVIITSDPRTNIETSYRLYSSLPTFHVSKGWHRQSLMPGIPDTVWVEFKPDEAGLLVDTLKLLKTIKSRNDTVRIPVRGTAIEPVAYMQISTSSIDFGEVASGDSTTASLVISNLPNALGKLALSRSTLVPPFIAKGAEYDTIEPGQNATLTIAFAPQWSGQFYSKLLITHNSPDLPNPFEIVLRGSSITTGVNEHPGNSNALLQLHVEPNPVGKNGLIRFRLPQAADVVLEVFALDGHSVSHLAKGRYTAGEHRVEWNTEGLARGTYLCRLTAGEKETSVMMNVE